MRRIIRPLFAALCAIFIRSDSPPTAAADAPPVPPPIAVPGDTCAATKAPLTAITWNVAMAPGMNPLYRAREAFIPGAVKAMDYDVLCVQEAWRDEDKMAIVAASGLPPENVLYIDTAGLGEDEGDRCASSEIESALDCAKAECADGPPEDTTLCAMDRCKTSLALLYLHDRRCLTCLASMAGGSPDDITRTCSEKGSSRVYGGKNGVLLLSRWPLYDKQVVFLPSSFANRPGLFARVHVPGVPEPIEIGCTHVSSPQQIPPSQPGHADWMAEQRAQARIMTETLAARAGGRPSLLLGDMNFGAAHGDAIGDYYRLAWDDVIASGYRDPAAEAEPPFCSVCGENNVRGAPGGEGFLFDHVFFRDPPGGATLDPLCADRLNDRQVEATDFRGRPVATYLSDHYSIRVKFGFK